MSATFLINPPHFSKSPPNLFISPRFSKSTPNFHVNPPPFRSTTILTRYFHKDVAECYFASELFLVGRLNIKTFLIHKTFLLLTLLLLFSALFLRRSYVLRRIYAGAERLSMAHSIMHSQKRPPVVYDRRSSTVRGGFVFNIKNYARSA